MRQLYRLIDNCLLAGGDPNAWRLTLAYGIRDMFGGVFAHAGEFRFIHDDERAEVLHMVDTGWPRAEQHDAFVRYQVEGAHRFDPLRAAITGKAKKFLVTSVDCLVDADAFFSSEFYEQYMAPADIGDQLISIAPIADSRGERSSLHTCIRGRSEPLFDDEERRLMRLLTFEISGLIGTRLADTSDPIVKLTDRLRQALALLLQGLSEADAAGKMGVAVGTFHKYVTEIYSTLGVRSRAELHVKFASRGVPVTGSGPADSRLPRIRREGAPMAKPWRSPDYIRRAMRQR